MRANRRQFIVGASSLALAGLSMPSRGDDLPSALADVQKQYYNFLSALVSSPGVTAPQLVLNNTIVPLDASVQTPYFNQELFRLYADQTFSNPFQNFPAPSAMNQSGRFSTLYRDIITIAAAQVDQNHPEIGQVVADLQSKLDDAQTRLNDKNKQFDDQWAAVARDRNLQPGTREYALNYLTWLEQVRYADQIATYSNAIDRLNAQISAVRRSKWSLAEIALLDNSDSLMRSFDIARPRYAQTEIDNKLTDLMLADPHQTPAAIFDSSPLILPIADFKSFLTNENTGRSFDTTSTSTQISSGSQSWYGSGGVSAFGWSIGGGGSGASSYRNEMSSLKSIHIGFKNVDEMYIDRGQWFSPGVLQNSAILKLVKDLNQLQYLKYVAVSLFVGRGLSMTLTLNQSANSSNWSTQTISAQGGASFLGLSFGVSGGSSRTSQNFTSNANGATITFTDGDNVIRVLGARVEPFLMVSQPGAADAADPSAYNSLYDDYKAGRITSYLEFQKRKLQLLGH